MRTPKPRRPPKRKCRVRRCIKPARALLMCDHHYRRHKGGEILPLMDLCSIEGCDYIVRARGLCNKHWQRWNNYGDPMVDHSLVAGPCSVDDCDRKRESQGLCRMHYDRKRHGRPLEGTDRKRGKCAICRRPHYSKGLCRKHWRRWRKHGDPWFDGKNFPKPPVNRIQPMFVPLVLDPLLRFIDERGGLAAAIARSGPGFGYQGAERDKIEKALDRAINRGYVDLAVADFICCAGLRTHPALIWPEDYWTATKREDIEDNPDDEEEWQEAA